MTINNYALETIKGEQANLSDYQGKVLVIVNTASKCGFTSQYEGLQNLYAAYQSQGLEVLGFPCNQFGGQEPGDNNEVDSFCQINYGVNFPLFAKIDVKGANAHPLFQQLTEEAPFAGFNLDEPAGARFHSMFENNMPEELKSNAIKWNFTKFLIDREGHVIKRYESYETPQSMKEDIEKLL
ncbi:glutathione peroxidase [Paenibacillus terrigena]|uniref:glutathione peroxidase n=1 Tax=Paenibacillus terrigena TaxID=369333 RepID=UPI000377A824|nr:glutathione peroxidase [Paenibacillus terrigena]